jgi:hypothetical protein
MIAFIPMTATMYTTLELEDIVECTGFAIQEAFTPPPPSSPTDPPSYRSLVYRGPHLPAQWASSHHPPSPSDPTHYSAGELTRLVRILVEHTFIQNGDSIRRQSTGLPMGTNPAPQLADLTCFEFEARAMDNLCMEEPQTAQAFANTFRYIDDTLALANASFEEGVTLVGQDPVRHPIYPPSLSLNRTSDSGRSVDYLGMTISRRQNGIVTRVSNSTQRLPVAKLNFPDLSGNFPAASGYGVFIGQLHRFARISTAARDFITSAVALVTTLQPKGYSRNRLRHLFQAFISQHNPYKSSFVGIIRRFNRRLTLR